MTFCTQADVEQTLQWDITAEPEDVVTALIGRAQALIEADVGRPLESDSRTDILDGGHNTLFLTHWPVTAISSVTEDGESLTAEDDYIFYEEGRLLRVSGGYQIPWRTRKLRSITVEYTGGYESGTHDIELTHLKNLCTEVVARAFRQGAASAAAPAGAGLAGISQVSLNGSDSVSFATPGGGSIELGGGLTRFVFLLQSEREQLGRYRTPLIA